MSSSYVFNPIHQSLNCQLRKFQIKVLIKLSISVQRSKWYDLLTWPLFTSLKPLLSWKYLYSQDSSHKLLMTVWSVLVWSSLPDISERSGALKVDSGFWLIAGGLASVRVGGHTIETDLVAPGQERWDARWLCNSRKMKRWKVTCTNTNAGELRDWAHFLSSVLDVGWRISIKAAPNFCSNRRTTELLHVS